MSPLLAEGALSGGGLVDPGSDVPSILSDGNGFPAELLQQCSIAIIIDFNECGLHVGWGSSWTAEAL